MAGPYSYFFLKPDRVNILEGFTTKLVVWGVPTKRPDQPENVTKMMKFRVDGPRDAIKIVEQPDTSFVEVKGVQPYAEASFLVASPKRAGPSLPRIEARAELTVNESDLLVYAPDGNVYWVKTEAWMNAPKFPIDSKSLNNALLPLLKNEAVVANIPNSNIPPAPPLPAKARGKQVESRAEPITCFLLNLNSILLSYTPGSGLLPGEQGSSQNPSDPQT